MSVRARQVALAVRSFLVRAEDLLVAVHAAYAVAFGRVISSRALLGILRRVNKHVSLLERVAVELDVDEAVVVVVGVIPARRDVRVALSPQEGVLAVPVAFLALPNLVVCQILLRRVADVLAGAAARCRRERPRVVGALDGAAFGPLRDPLTCEAANLLLTDGDNGEMPLSRPYHANFSPSPARTRRANLSTPVETVFLGVAALVPRVRVDASVH